MIYEKKVVSPVFQMSFPPAPVFLSIMTFLLSYVKVSEKTFRAFHVLLSSRTQSHVLVLLSWHI